MSYSVLYSANDLRNQGETRSLKPLYIIDAGAGRFSYMLLCQAHRYHPGAASPHVVNKGGKDVVGKNNVVRVPRHLVDPSRVSILLVVLLDAQSNTEWCRVRQGSITVPDSDTSSATRIAFTIPLSKSFDMLYQQTRSRSTCCDPCCRRRS